MARDAWACRYCGGPAVQVDHVVPRAHGGGADPDNLVAACRRCNQLLGAKRFADLEEKRAWILARRRALGEPPSVEPSALAVARERNVPAWVVYRERSRARKRVPRRG